MFRLLLSLLGLLAASPICRQPCVNGEILKDIDFTDVPFSWFNGPNAKWDVEGDAEVVPSNKGLLISSNPYTTWSSSPAPFYVDHVKSLVQLDENLLPNAKLYVEAVMTGHTFGTENNPFPANMVHEEDVRLGSCGLCVTMLPGTVSRNRYMILLTNDRVYAAYESVLLDTGFPFGYLMVRPIGRRTPEQIHSVAIEIDPMAYPQVEGMKVSLDGGKLFQPFTVTNLEYLIVNNVILAFTPDSNSPTYVSFGHFTFLDGYSPCKDIGSGCNIEGCARTPVTFGLVNTGFAFSSYDPLTAIPSSAPSQYWGSVGTTQANHIWGQGSELLVKSLLIRAFNPGCDV